MQELTGRRENIVRARKKMSQLSNASLEEKTQEYWKVSQAARGLGKNMTTGKAISTTSNLL